jgi:hypothetical protein
VREGDGAGELRASAAERSGRGLLQDVKGGAGWGDQAAKENQGFTNTSLSEGALAGLRGDRKRLLAEASSGCKSWSSAQSSLAKVRYVHE